MKLFDLKKEYDIMKTEIDFAIQEVLNSTMFIMGPNVEKFEQAFAEFCGAKFAISVASGTDALVLALMAIDIQPGDEVITTPFTFFATAEAIALLKATPVFVDIDPETFNINAKLIENKITKKTKAIIPVHLYGQAADMDEIMAIAKKHNLYVIEDAAQSAGSKYKEKTTGTIGHMGCFSFFPSKNLGCYGDGGLVTTNDETFAKQIKLIRLHGSIKRYEHECIGVNSRLDTIQAAILNVKLRHFTNTLALREKVSKLYLEKLQNLPNLKIPFTKKDRNHTFNQFTIRVKDREKIINFLTKANIPTAVHYPKPLHLQQALAYLGYKKGDLPESEKAAQEVLSLPMFPYLEEQEINEVVKTLEEALA